MNDKVIRYVVPNSWTSAEGRPGSIDHIDLEEYEGQFVEDTGMYATLCKPYGWAATGWLRLNERQSSKLCVRCERLYKQKKAVE